MSRDVLISTTPSPIVYLETRSETAVVDGAVLQEAAAAASYTLTADVGALTFAGIAVSFGQIATRNVLLSSFPAPVVVVDSAARQTPVGLIILNEQPPVAGYSLAAERGIYTFTGRSADLAFSGGFRPEPRAFVLTGRAAIVRHDKRLTATTGAFAYQLAAIQDSLEAFSGEFVFTGNAAELIYASTTTKLIAAGATFALTGASAGFSRSLPFGADSGAFALTGHGAEAIVGNRSLGAEPGAFILLGSPTGNVILAKRGAFAVSSADTVFTLNADTFWTRVDDTPEVWTKISV